LKTLLVTRLALREFRNIESLSIEPAPRFNVIAGDNGQGKTSLLEALYAVATSRSFRTERLKELQREGSDFARVDAELLEDGLARAQRLTVSGGGRAVFLDGERAERLADYAVRTPMVVFHPGDLELTMGGATRRRDLLDRVGLFTDPAAADHRRRYRHALRERQKVLELRGERAPELGAYEQLVAHHGAQLGLIHVNATEALAREAEPAWRRLVASDLSFAMRYQAGGALDQDRFRAELEARRTTDRRRRAATFGPHKDDLELVIDGRPARKHASQGQHRILTLSLKLAELAAIREARGAHPILLLDDVSSELDPTRIGAVYEFLNASPSQVFVTTTRPELFQTPGAKASERRDYRLRGGALSDLGPRPGEAFAGA
jgi:DNA replication and repair protein RecF